MVSVNDVDDLNIRLLKYIRNKLRFLVVTNILNPPLSLSFICIGDSKPFAKIECNESCLAGLDIVAIQSSTRHMCVYVKQR